MDKKKKGRKKKKKEEEAVYKEKKAEKKKKQPRFRPGPGESAQPLKSLVALQAASPVRRWPLLFVGLSMSLRSMSLSS